MVSSSAATVISNIQPKIDLGAVYQEFEQDSNKAMQFGYFASGKFAKAIAITLHGRTEDGIKTNDFNGGMTYEIGVKLDSDDEEAFNNLEEAIGVIVDRENEESMSVGDFDSVWELSPITRNGILKIKLKVSGEKFKAKFNKNFDLKKLHLSFIEPNQKVEAKGKLLWWANAKDGKLGVSFQLESMNF